MVRRNWYQLNDIMSWYVVNRTGGAGVFRLVNKTCWCLIEIMDK